MANYFRITAYHPEENISAIFDSAGEQLCAAVLDDVQKEYGREMADRLCRYRHVNFSVCQEP